MARITDVAEHRNGGASIGLALAVPIVENRQE